MVKLLNSTLLSRIVLPRVVILPIQLPINLVTIITKYLPVKTMFNGFEKTLMLKPMALIKVTVEKAQDLQQNHPGSAKHGCVDFLCNWTNVNSYVKIIIGDQEYTSEPDVEHDSNPEWHFVALHPVEHIHNQKIIVQLFHDEKSLLGQVTERISNICRSGMIDEWYSLEDHPGGRIKINFECLKVTNSSLQSVIITDIKVGVLRTSHKISDSKPRIC
jgi:Ca2+-dependent lipid-binding protein